MRVGWRSDAACAMYELESFSKDVKIKCYTHTRFHIGCETQSEIKGI